MFAVNEEPQGEAVRVFCAMLEDYLVRRDVQATLAWMDARVHSIGTGKTEVALSREELRLLLIEEMQQDPLPYRLRYDRLHCDAYNDSLALIFSELTVEKQIEANQCLSMQLRITAMLCRKEGEFRIYGLHSSMPSVLQADHEYFPVSFGKTMFSNITEDESSLVQQLLSDRMLHILGSYMEDGEPLFFISDSLLSLLGYTKQELTELAKDGIFALICPQDREEATLCKWGQIMEKDDYSLCYRMLKKDGSLLPVLDQGCVYMPKDDKMVTISQIQDLSAVQEQLKAILQ